MTNKYIKSIFGLSVLASAAFSQGIAKAQTTIPDTSPPRELIISKTFVNEFNNEIELPGLNVSVGDSISGLGRTINTSGPSGFNSGSLGAGFNIRTWQINSGGGYVTMNATINGKGAFVFILGSYSLSQDSNNRIVGLVTISGSYSDSSGFGYVLSCTGDYKNLYAGGTCKIYAPNGEIYTFFSLGTPISRNSNTGAISSIGGGENLETIEKPNGEIIKFYYSKRYGGDLQTVKSSLGWMFKMQYANYTPTYEYISNQSAINISKVYCDELSMSCIDANASRSIEFNRVKVGPLIEGTVNAYNNELSVSKNGVPLYKFLNIYDHYTMNSISYAYLKTKTLTFPSGASVVYEYFPDDRTGISKFSAAIGNSVWRYEKSNNWPGDTRVINPDGKTKVTYNNINGIEGTTDELGRNTYFGYTWANSQIGAYGMVSEEYSPDSPGIHATSSGVFGRVSADNKNAGGVTQYSYTRGNLSQVTVIPLDGSAKSITQYAIPQTCPISNYKVCNQPTYMIDPKGNRTDYTYAPEHGGVLTETGSADANGVRPQKRYEYTPLSAKYMDSSGNLQNFPPVYRLTKVSKCKTATAANPASCVGSADELITTYAYDTPNLQLTSETQSTGNGSISSTIFYGYDDIGNKVWTDGPRTDVDDKAYVTYDVLRRPVFEIGIDPDGGGPLRRATIKHNYDVDGREWKTENGTCGTVSIAGSIPNGCNDFVVNNFTRNTYDASTGLLAKTEVVQP